MDARVRGDHEQEESLQSRLGWDTRPRADEAAMWTLVSAVGQFVLVGWAASIGSLMLILGWSFVQNPTGVPSWVNGLIAAFFVILGASLAFFSVRLLVQALRAFWAAIRKGWFLVHYRASPHPARARAAAEGDPLLDPYLRFLVKRGFIPMEDESAGRPL